MSIGPVLAGLGQAATRGLQTYLALQRQRQQEEEERRRQALQIALSLAGADEETRPFLQRVYSALFPDIQITGSFPSKPKPLGERKARDILKDRPDLLKKLPSELLDEPWDTVVRVRPDIARELYGKPAETEEEEFRRLLEAHQFRERRAGRRLPMEGRLLELAAKFGYAKSKPETFTAGGFGSPSEAIRAQAGTQIPTGRVIEDLPDEVARPTFGDLIPAARGTPLANQPVPMTRDGDVDWSAVNAALRSVGAAPQDVRAREQAAQEQKARYQAFLRQKLLAGIRQPGSVNLSVLRAQMERAGMNWAVEVTKAQDEVRKAAASAPVPITIDGQTYLVPQATAAQIAAGDRRLAMQIRAAAQRMAAAQAASMASAARRGKFTQSQLANLWLRAQDQAYQEIAPVPGMPLTPEQADQYARRTQEIFEASLQAAGALQPARQPQAPPSQGKQTLDPQTRKVISEHARGGGAWEELEAALRAEGVTDPKVLREARQIYETARKPTPSPQRPSAPGAGTYEALVERQIAIMIDQGLTWPQIRTVLVRNFVRGGHPMDVATRFVDTVGRAIYDRRSRR